MNLSELKSFFKWCTIINGVLLLISVVADAIAPSAAVQIHSALFQIPTESVSQIMYALLGIYKILWLALNLVPYIALGIVSAKPTNKR